MNEMFHIGFVQKMAKTTLAQHISACKHSVHICKTAITICLLLAVLGAVCTELEH